MKEIRIVKNGHVVMSEKDVLNFDICEYSKLHRKIYESVPCKVRFVDDGVVVKEISIKSHK